jgi:hypothetical protein
MQLKRPSKPKSNWEIISNPILAATWPDDAYVQAMCGFLVYESPATLEQKLPILLRTARFRRHQNAFQTRVEDFLGAPVPMRSISFVNVWKLFYSIIHFSSNELNFYAESREQIQSSICLGNFGDAELLLDEAHERLGDSFWYLKTKLCLLSYQSKSQEMADLCNAWLARAPTSSIKYFITTFQLIADTGSNAHLHWGSFVESITRELAEGGEDASVELITFFCSPTPLLGAMPGPSLVKLLQTLPLIDLYNGVLYVLKDVLADESLRDVEWAPANPRAFATRLSGFLSDKVVQRLLAPEDASSKKPDLSALGSNLIGLYEKGHYRACIAAFRTNISLLPSPLAYVNIVAKAVAYIGEAGWENGFGLIGEIVLDLADIYRLNERSSLARDQIISRMIQLHGVLPASSLQLTLIVALPHVYATSSTRSLIKLALFENDEVTPLLYAAAKTTNTAQLVRRDIFTAGDADNQRIIRRKICDLIDTRAESSDVFSAFKLLRESGVLTKDYFELLAHYCLDYGHVERLLNEVASELVRNPHLYICLPLLEMVERVDSERIASLDAIIVCDTFNRRVNTSKDFVLNETVEDYLDSHEVERPSELLKEVTSIEEKEVAFFLEICTPEVMDFLSCFVDSDDLRAERMEILDRLLALNAVDPDKRMKEVEFLVSQTLIDSVTNKINGPKIYVDSEFVVKKARAEIEALLLTYKVVDANEPDTERFTLLASEFNENDGPHRAYASGARANAVLKMRSVVGNIFLFDEKHGLDKNLSTEIRHGFFSNLMRARLEEHHLITEADESGKYESNFHWRRINDFLYGPVLDQIDEALAQFSFDFDTLIIAAEGWMKLGDKPGEGPFMEMMTDEVDSLKNAASRGSSADELIDSILEVIWNRTEAWLADMRERLNVTFRSQVDTLFARLESEVAEEIASGAALLEFTAALRRVRGEISEDISTAAEWFRRASTIDLGDSNVENVVKAAASSFEKVKSLMGALNVSVDPNVRSVEVRGNAVKPLVIAIINLFDNCFTHSGFGRNTSVNVNVSIEDNYCIIEIANKLSDQRQAKLSPQLIRELNAKARSHSSTVLLRAEGGSGVSKAYQQLIASRVNSNLEVLINDDCFVARISYCCESSIH